MPKKTITVLILHASGNIELLRIDNTLSALQKIVGGHIEPYYDRHCLNGHAYVNDEGLIIGLPYNSNAEKYLGTSIRGDAVLMTHDQYGNDDDVTVQQIRCVLNTVFGLPE
jgi:hypothetical protein